MSKFETMADAVEKLMREIELAQARVFDACQEDTRGPARVAKIDERIAEAERLKEKLKGVLPGDPGNADRAERALWWKLISGEVVPRQCEGGAFHVTWRGRSYLVGSDALYQYAEREHIAYDRYETFYFNRGNYPVVTFPSHFPKWDLAGSQRSRAALRWMT